MRSPSASARRLSGLAGGVLAPVSGVFPTIGVAYVAKSFITVIGGGAAILAGTASASALFGAINQFATFADDAGVRRGRAARRGDRADPPAAAGHHRPLLPEGASERAVPLNRLGTRRSSASSASRCPGPAPRCRRASSSCSNSRVYMIMAMLALSLALHLGLWRHPVLRPVRVLRARRLYLRRSPCSTSAKAPAPFAAGDRSCRPVFAALLGYFMFYGRISDVYLGVITLTVTLILFNFVNSTAGAGIPYRRGGARRLQRHSGDSAAQHPRRQDGAGRSRRHVLSLDGALARRPISGCACCWRAASAASSSASAKTSGAPSCSATTRAPTSSRPSPSAARSPASPAACSPIGATSSARPSSAWRNPRRSSSG